MADTDSPMALPRGTGFERLLPVLLLTAAACGTSDGQSTPPPAASTPATTAALVSSTNEPLRVLGSDEQEHLEYDLIMTNYFNAVVTLSSIDVLDPEGATLLHLEGGD